MTKNLASATTLIESDLIHMESPFFTVVYNCVKNALLWEKTLCYVSIETLAD